LELSNVLKSRRARGQLELLVSWTSQAAAEATWIPVDEFRILYLSYQLADELLLQGGGEMSCTGFHTGVTRREQRPAQIQELRDNISYLKILVIVG
jgi:hypothetical protein